MRESTGWRSWSGAVHATPQRLVHPGSVAELCALVERAADAQTTVRPVGSGHSFTPVAAGEDTMVSLDGMAGGQVEIAADGHTVVVPAGMTLHTLGSRLEQAGLAMHNLGDIDRQAVAGALATGTHGTGAAFGPLHTAVEAIELVDGTGELRWVDEADLPAARLAVGALGVMTRIRLSVRPAFRLATRTLKVSLDDALTDFPHHAADHRHAEFYWLPHTRWCQLKLADETDEEALGHGVAQAVNDLVLENAGVWLVGQVAKTFPRLSPRMASVLAAGVSDVQSRRPSHEAYASTRLVRFQEMEFALPAAALGEAMEGLDELIRRESFPVSLPVEVRTVAADTTAWLSPAWGRASVYVAVHAFRGMPYTAYFAATQELLMGLGGRPHWGKMHTLGRGELAARYPRFADFQAARSRLDPAGVFESAYLRRILGPIDA